MEWIKITERLPEEGEMFIAARWSMSKGYQPELCFRYEGRYYYPYDTELFVEAQDYGIASEDDTYEGGTTPPDWWTELPLCRDLEVYDDSPTARMLDKINDEFFNGK